VRALFAYFSRPYERAHRAAEHYARLVAQARRPEFYESLGAPDTFDGRFDLIVLHASLYLKRMKAAGREGRDLAQAVFDHMFADLDQTLRELGVGDTTIAKKMRAMVSAFYGRAAAYDKALESGDNAALADALVRNIFAGEAPPPDKLRRLSTYLRDTAKALAEAPDAAIVGNQFNWLSPTIQQ
jgi:cytochrome b pre-mRNA-processing protein 3